MYVNKISGDSFYTDSIYLQLLLLKKFNKIQSGLGIE